MTNEPVPCPFCGAEWIPRDHGFIHGKVPPVGWDEFCLLQGTHMLASVVGRYNTRAAKVATITYKLVDDYPVFTDNGEGPRVSADFLNECFNYVRKQAHDILD